MTATDTSPIVVRDLKKQYGSFPALRGIDLDVNSGGVFALLGPNGGGAFADLTGREVVRHFAAFFPLTWMALGLSAVFLPSGFAVVEPAKSFELPRVALVLTAWCAGPLVVSLFTFRWRDARNR
jgi:hypothetical protein